MTDTSACPRCGQEYDAAENACPACGRLAQAATCERHPGRAASGQCVLCGSAVCDDCDDGNRAHYSCPEHRDIPVVEGWAQIYTTGDEVEAGLIRENLRSEGIDAAVLSQKDSAFALDLGDLSPVRVLVPAFAWEEASELLAGRMDGSGEVSFACPGCGEAYDEGATVCAHCGSLLRQA